MPRKRLDAGCVTTPPHEAAFGADPDRHVQGLTGVFRAFLRMEVSKKGLVLGAFYRIVDEEMSAAWLETEKEINVSFYRKHGFEVMSEDRVNGVPNEFMERKARA